MKTLLSVCILAMVAGTMAQSWTTIKELEGTWTAIIEFPIIIAVTDQGPSIICRDQLTPDCDKELPQLLEAATFEKNTMFFNSSQFLGIDTVEKAAEAFPQCAASGVFPLQSVFNTPVFEIVDFDPFKGSITFINPLRPSDTNCGFFILNRADKVPTLTFQYSLTFNGTLVELGTSGPLFTCERQPGFCSVKKSGDLFDAALFRDFTNPCVAGPCLDLPKPVVVSKKHFIVINKTPKEAHEG